MSEDQGSTACSTSSSLAKKKDDIPKYAPLSLTLHLHLHQGHSSSQSTYTDKEEEDDHFTMSVTRNTHPETTISLLCFVVV